MDFEVTLKMEAPVLRMLEQGDRSADPRWPCCHCCYVAKLRPTLRDPMDCSPPGFSDHGRRAKMLEWVVMPPPGNLPDPGIEPESPVSPALAGRFFYHWVTRVELLILGLHYCEEVINFYLASATNLMWFTGLINADPVDINENWIYLRISLT